MSLIFDSIFAVCQERPASVFVEYPRVSSKASMYVEMGRQAFMGVVDYRWLNRITKRNSALLPRLDEIFDIIKEAKFFSKMELKTRVTQIHVNPEDAEKTVFTTKYGQFEHLLMPMRLCSAPATFPSLLNQYFYDCIDFFMVLYMDDLLIFSKDEASHLKHLETVLSRLKENKLFISSEKCEFGKTEIKFLSFTIGRDGLQANPAEDEIFKSSPKPKTLTEVRIFMGLQQFFRIFTKNFS